ncbi:hypothetical protein ACEV8A_24675 [Vibrio parahaemolyticus]|uniref:hypothetical protein n=1 Tax=Vibrio harveyi group TaxID=717610 RepID=UPI0006C103FA|nr:MULTISPECIES: hypothetical protein [Vibrio harveyi group]EGR1589058.1 hypothetical protein [Vibrio parahaemolyticus]EHR1202701.1 hypothetical protein [Vibrio parahaemolyticus]EHR5855141.1 hypothetical protein [Vibrio parahaemolyticus]ELA7191474.1 hypothetical protein [Vibrio alginolyticus]KAB2114767.1 hypothetical protein F6475_13025 [Vibrio alginolyticus]
MPEKSGNSFNPIGVQKPEQASSASPTSKPIQGSLTKHIGEGENAKNSFIWMTITWSFIIGSGLSFLVYIRSFFFDAPTTSALTDTLSMVWSVFAPFITLALGYAFGKGETK